MLSKSGSLPVREVRRVDFGTSTLLEDFRVGVACLDFVWSVLVCVRTLHDLRRNGVDGQNGGQRDDGEDEDIAEGGRCDHRGITVVSVALAAPRGYE